MAAAAETDRGKHIVRRAQQQESRKAYVIVVGRAAPQQKQLEGCLLSRCATCLVVQRCDEITDERQQGTRAVLPSLQSAFFPSVSLKQ